MGPNGIYLIFGDTEAEAALRAALSEHGLQEAAGTQVTQMWHYFTGGHLFNLLAVALLGSAAATGAEVLLSARDYGVMRLQGRSYLDILGGDLRKVLLLSAIALPSVAAATLTFLGVYNGWNQIVHVRTRAQEIFARHISGWTFAATHRCLLLVEGGLAVAFLGWATWDTLRKPAMASDAMYGGPGGMGPSGAEPFYALGIVLVSMVITITALVENATVKANLDVARRRGTRPDHATALERVGLAGREKEKVHHLSGCEQQRVALGRLMVKRPSLVLADEPTGALDHDNGAMVVDVLRRMSREGCAVVIATHNDSVRDACDTVFDVASQKELAAR